MMTLKITKGILEQGVCTINSSVQLPLKTGALRAAVDCIYLFLYSRDLVVDTKCVRTPTKVVSGKA